MEGLYIKISLPLLDRGNNVMSDLEIKLDSILKETKSWYIDWYQSWEPNFVCFYKSEISSLTKILDLICPEYTWIQVLSKKDWT